MKNSLRIIAEMSGNHNQSLERALMLVDAAADAGADALKLQTYTPDSMTLNIRDREFFFIDDTSSPWFGRASYDIYREAALPYAWHKAIFDRCRKRGILGFSTPFDRYAVDFLEDLGVPLYKIASAEIVDIPLLKRVAATRKPVLLSTGMATLEEIQEAVSTLYEGGCPRITILKCTTSYPAPVDDSNLLTIPDLKRQFPDCSVGLSDHTLGTAVPVAAVALGAAVIEKHLTLLRADGGVDSAFSLEPAEFRLLVAECRSACKALGSIMYGPAPSEIAARHYRRSLFAVKDIRQGERFTPENVRSIRPASGLHPRHYEELLSRAAAVNIPAGTPLVWEHVL